MGSSFTVFFWSHWFYRIFIIFFTADQTRYEETVFFVWIPQSEWDKVGPQAFSGRFYWFYSFIRNFLLPDEIWRIVSQIFTDFTDIFETIFNQTQHGEWFHRLHWIYRLIRNFFFRRDIESDSIDFNDFIDLSETFFYQTRYREKFYRFFCWSHGPPLL